MRGWEPGGGQGYPPGMKAQVGGGLAVLLGLLLLVFFPEQPSGATPDLHSMARISIGIGVLLIAAGSAARWYLGK
jgi:hypothetical protein